jgi:Flp pilus assembly pilin Flp
MIWKNLVKQTQRFLYGESGPTAVEYAVLLSLVVIIALAGIRTLGITARESFHLVGLWVGS